MLDSAANAVHKGQAAWLTPPAWAEALALALPSYRPVIVDLTCGNGQLLAGASAPGTFHRLGCDIEALEAVDGRDKLMVDRVRLPHGRPRQHGLESGAVRPACPGAAGNPPFIQHQADLRPPDLCDYFRVQFPPRSPFIGDWAVYRTGELALVIEQPPLVDVVALMRPKVPVR